MISLHTRTDEEPTRSRQFHRFGVADTDRVDPGRASTRNRAARGIKLDERQLSSLAWDFLRSEFTGLIYADWPVDRRLEAYLTHLGMSPVVNNGDAFDAVLQQVLAKIGPALRAGILTTTTWVTSRRSPVSGIGADASVPSAM